MSVSVVCAIQRTWSSSFLISCSSLRIFFKNILDLLSNSAVCMRRPAAGATVAPEVCFCCSAGPGRRAGRYSFDLSKRLIRNLATKLPAALIVWHTVHQLSKAFCLTELAV